MSWSGNVQIHGLPNTGYPGKPNIYSYVSFSDVYRDGNTVYCDVSASLNAMTAKSYFGYYINVYAQIDNGEKVLLYHKPNSPNTWKGDVYKGSGRIYATNTTESVVLSIWFESSCGNECWSAPHPYKMFTVNASAPSMTAPDITARITDYSYGYISWEAFSNTSCDQWAYSVDSQPWKIYYDSVGTTSTGFSINVYPGVHTLWVQGKRVNGKWGQSNLLTYDCRIPTINNAVITVSSDTSGTLSFNTDVSVNYYLNDVYLGTGAGDISANVSLKSNSNTDYTLKVIRTSNRYITNSKQLSADTTRAKITLRASIIGTSLQYTISCDTMCKDCNLIMTDTSPEGTQKTKTIVVSKDPGTLWNMSIDNLNAGHTYTLQSYATRTSNNVKSYSNTFIGVAEGCAHIGTSTQEYSICVPYIYDVTKGWVKAEPYVYDNGDWKVCE